MFRILEILLEGLVLYLLYRFVVFFVIPVVRTIRRAKKQMKDINEKVNEQMGRDKRKYTQNHQHQSPHTSHASPQSHECEDEGEYIDYEEVK